MTNHDFCTAAGVADRFDRNRVIALKHHIKQFQRSFFFLAVMVTRFVRIDRARAVLLEHPIVFQQQLRVPKSAVTAACGFAGLFCDNFLGALTSSLSCGFLNNGHHFFRDSHFAHPPVLSLPKYINLGIIDLLYRGIAQAILFFIAQIAFILRDTSL